jgi:hypothetical protein
VRRRKPLPAKQYRKGIGRPDGAKGSLISNVKDRFALFVSVVAFCISVYSFVQLQIDRTNTRIEKKPSIGFEFVGYGSDERYGFYIRNTGENRAAIRKVEFTYNNLADKGLAAVLLDKLDFKASEYQLSRLGENFVLAGGANEAFYTFTKPLSVDDQSIFEQYSQLIAADICYCDLIYSFCHAKRISRVIGADSPPEFICTVDAMRPSQ